VIAWSHFFWASVKAVHHGTSTWKNNSSHDQDIKDRGRRKGLSPHVPFKSTSPVMGDPHTRLDPLNVPPTPNSVTGWGIRV
jgi:hypothetical protein